MSEGTESLSEEAIEFAHRVFDMARDGKSEELSPVLAAGLPPDIRTDKGDSLLMLASYHGHAETTRVLLKHGADPDLPNDRNQTPLAGVVFKDDMTLVNLLLAYGATVDGRPAGAKTPLMYAAMFNRCAILERLLVAGADPALTDADGQSALDLARTMGADGAVVLLAGPECL